ncbi:MAG: preprotein translocase subunit SecY [Clostridia bacterium]|nr:preprotein translocase subunit SecY [Clostridia bacterium]
MFQSIRKIWKIEDLRKKVIFTFGMLLLYSLVGQIYAPGINIEIVKAITESQGVSPLLGMMNMMTGGATGQMTIMAMGISPYINASIIMQLLCIAIPYLERVQQEPDGREKISRWTRYLTVVLAAIQAIGLSNATLYNGMVSVVHEGWWNNLFIGVSMAGGSALAMWIGEKITDKGIGNGISLLIFVGIAGNLIGGLGTSLLNLFTGFTVIGLVKLLVFVLAVLIIIVCVTFVDLGERRVPLQISKQVRGRRTYGGQNTHLGLKIVSVGVLPLIFASSFLSFPGIIYQLTDWKWLAGAANALSSQTNVWYIVISSVLIVAFTFFYSSISFDAKKQAQQLQEQGATIPGNRSKNIEGYLQRTVNRLNLFAALFLAVLNIIGSLLMGYANPGVAFAASSVLIAVSVSLETIRTMEGELSIRGIETSKDNGFM